MLTRVRCTTMRCASLVSVLQIIAPYFTKIHANITAPLCRKRSGNDVKTDITLFYLFDQPFAVLSLVAFYYLASFFSCAFCAQKARKKQRYGKSGRWRLFRARLRGRKSLGWRLLVAGGFFVRGYGDKRTRF